MNTMNFADNLKRLRERLGLSKDELAKSLDVSGVMVGYWESGRNEPRLSKLERIAEVLGVTTYELLFVRPANNEMTVEQKRSVDLIAALSDEKLVTINEIMVNAIRESKSKS